MLMDSRVIQDMHWWYVLYPSFTITLAILLPISAATCWLRRHLRFDVSDFEQTFEGQQSQAAGKKLQHKMA